MDMQPQDFQEDTAAAVPPGAWYRTRRALFAAVVVIPALLVLLYGALLAGPKYESRAGFMVRGIEQEAPPVGGLAEMVGAAPLGAAQREAMAVQDYLLSLQAIEDLAARGIDVDALLHGPQADWWTTLRYPDRRAEGLAEYYRAMVSVDYDETSGIARIAARAYTPEDAKALAEALIAMGEDQINSFNQRSILAAEELARSQLENAEAELLEIQAQLTDYRDVMGELDPSATGRSAQEELESLEARLVVERSGLQAMRARLAEGSPLVVSARSRVDALQSAVAQLRADLTGDADALSRRLSAYETLALRQDLAGKRYEAAQAQLEEARSQAARERLFLVSVVNPGLPEKPVAPRPLRDALVVLVGLALAFAIAWLLIAGIREHQAD